MHNHLDDVFKKICIPVLLTYDSETVGSSNQCNEDYKQNIKNELISAYENIRGKLDFEYEIKYSQDFPLTVHVILIPLKEKKKLISALDQRLKALQI